MARYGAFLWSGDVASTWETLKTHLPVAVNTGLSGIPYWGTDIGGFQTTPEYLGELYVRWFQFAAFCPLFRAHGRTWHLRLPWGWNLGELGPEENAAYQGAGRPAESELRNAQVEPICRKFLELRYRLMPYLYSAVRETSLTGMPIMRALWLHYPDDATAVARGDQYFWGRDILVAPVVEKGATSRKVYLPAHRSLGEGGPAPGSTSGPKRRSDGGREIDRAVDLATMPLYVRAGAVIPMGPVKQYTAEPVDGPLTRHRLSRRRRLVRAVRGRRQVVRVPARRLDGDRVQVGGPRSAPVDVADARLPHARPARPRRRRPPRRPAGHPDCEIFGSSRLREALASASA